jgi:GNAT superfamily N-acetyltransferase
MNTNISPLPAGYTARGGHIDDYKRATDLLNAYSMQVNGNLDLNEPELLRLDWLNDGFKPETDIYMVFAPDGTLAAFAECWLTMQPPVHPWMFGRVHPAHWNKGLGSHITAWGEERARAALDLCAPDLRVAPRIGTESHNEAALALIKHMGYTPSRSFYRMHIDFDAAPEIPPPPQGIIIRPYDPETELEAVCHTFVDSFKDHFGFVEQPFEKELELLKHNLRDEPGYSPSMWLVAMDGPEMVGICIGRLDDLEDPTFSWVNELGVRRAWRKRGIGEALLKHAFAIAYAAGKKGVGLGVDATSLTGATRLYERAGMRVKRRFDQFEKELRAGKELGTLKVE